MQGRRPRGLGDGPPKFELGAAHASPQYIVEVVLSDARAKAGTEGVLKLEMRNNYAM